MVLPHSVILIFSVVQFIKCNPSITILSDLTKDSDVNFFENTLPWIVDNIGSEVRINYYFRDSGKTSGPRSCVLAQLKRNTYLQAEYLSCEAKGKRSQECAKLVAINPKILNNCIKRRVRGFIRAANREFSKYKIDSTPVIILQGRRNVISDVTPKTVLKTICTLFRRNKPTGCVKPLPIPDRKSTSDKEITTPVPDSIPPGENASTDKSEQSKEKDSSTRTDNKNTKENLSEENIDSSQNTKPSQEKDNSPKDKVPANTQDEENSQPKKSTNGKKSTKEKEPSKEKETPGNVSESPEEPPIQEQQNHPK